MLKIGVARTDITPPVGIALIGFAGRGPSLGVHDPLYATALVATDGVRTLAIVGCDLLYVGADLVALVREEVRTRLGIPGECVALSCTHTHYGPETRLDDAAPDVQAYLGALRFRLAGAVQEAAASAQPAQLGMGWGRSDIGINRRERRPDGVIVLGRNPEGPIDRALGVLRIDGVDGRPLATVYNFATHPVSQGGAMRYISADYPGQAREVVEQLTGAPCFQLQGACGNINSDRMEPTYEPARSLGTRLGCEVVRVWETIATHEATWVQSVSQVEALPCYRYGSQEQAEKLAADLERDLQRLKAEKASAGAIYWAESRLERVSAAVQSWRSGVPLEPVTAEFSAHRLGDLALATAPGEIFNELGVEVKSSSPFKDTFFVGYTNGSIGYVPVPAAYPEGGYEVTHACRVDPEASRILVRTCGQLLAQLHAGGARQQSG